MPLPRPVLPSELFVHTLATLTRNTPEERAPILDTCEALGPVGAAERGQRFEYSGYPGPHYVTTSGRFLIIYQFSSVEVRLKECRLKAST